MASPDSRILLLAVCLSVWLCACWAQDLSIVLPQGDIRGVSLKIYNILFIHKKSFFSWLLCLKAHKAFRSSSLHDTYSGVVNSPSREKNKPPSSDPAAYDAEVELQTFAF